MGATLSSLCSTPADMDTVDGNRFTYLTFCYRAHAIEILNQVKIASASDADNMQWKEISDMIRKYDVKMSDKTMKELREELENSRVSANNSIVERSKIVSHAFDTGLLSYLQAKVDLMEKLKDCLPNQGQSWEEFVMDRREGSILQHVQPDDLDDEDHRDDEDLDDEDEDLDDEEDLDPNAGLEVLETFKNWTRMLMSAIEGVEKSGVSQSVQKEKTIKVFYATNRCADDSNCTPKLGNCLLYGFQEVIIPSAHERGNDSKHSVLGVKKGLGKKLDEFLKEIEREFDSERAIPPHNDHSANDVASATGGPQKNARQVLLYIHGYAVCYKSALRRAAQLKDNLKFEGLVILYSWPTMGHVLAYLQDRKVSMRSAQHLGELITTILREVSSSEVHILAHSMGNRALIEALTKWPPLLSEEQVDQRGVLKNVILAAADEKLGKFEKMLPGMNKPDSVHCPLISVYSSACDWPLFVSGYINWKLRLGCTESLFGKHSMRGGDHMVDVIDASGVRYDSWLKHSYHAEAPEVLNDIQNLLTKHQRAEYRPVIEPLHHNSGQVFHACVPTWWSKSKFKGCIGRIQNQALPTRVTDRYE